MALSREQLALISRTAQAMARADGVGADQGNITQRLADRFGRHEADEMQQLRVVARSAIRTRELAREMEEDPTQAIAANRHAIDVGILPGEPRFRYRTVVRATNPDTGEAFETATNVESTRPLTFQQVSELAREHFRTNQLEDNYRARVDGAGQQPIYEVWLVNAGRGQ